MVWESWYWKRRLKELVFEIESIADQPDTSTLDVSNLEISIFTGFFLTRKLVEAQTKLSHKTENQIVRCQVSGKLADTPVVDVINRFDIHDLYDLESFDKKHLSLQKICNIFTHSVFLWMVYDMEDYSEGEGTISGVYVTSSYEKEKLLYWVEISEILRIFHSIINDEIEKLELIPDPKTREMKVKKN
tara:strand:- start:2678 stop:3241 length:564 start_codon:yes stop_codon:yes gene_type:complete